jgi:uncharacterized SAM-binding protein YcdF (DUF218 family)
MIKAMASILTEPLLLAACIGVIAAVLRMTGRRALAAGFAAAAAVVIYLGALSPLADALLTPLERRFPPLAADADVHTASYIVVLGSGFYPRSGVPITAELDDEGLPRIVEGVRLARLHHLPLIVSGGKSPGTASPALGYAQLARELGIDDSAITISAEGADTHAEALAIARLVGAKPFIVVSSASHMPRAVALLRRAGTQPMAAPTAQRAFPIGSNALLRCLPSIGALRKTKIALHEYLGLLAIRLGWD